MIFGSSRRPRAVGFDMTPMIDVVLQLIIFFLFTSQLSQVIRSPIDLPEQPGDALEAAAPGGVVIDIGADGAYLIEGRQRSLEEVVRIVRVEQEQARAEGQPLSLLVRADRGAAALHVNVLASRLAQAEIRQWKLGTTVPAGGGQGP